MALISSSGGWRSLTVKWIVWWLSDRIEDGLTIGYTIWWIVGATMDHLHQFALEGIFASWPGFGTPTSLPMIGRSRGMIRGMQESDASYAARLVQWKTRWQHAGSMENLVQGFHEYILGQPRCYIVNRAGTRVTIGPDGTMTKDTITWDWDSLSNPERAGYWSELWIVVFSSPWGPTVTQIPNWHWGQDDFGSGLSIARVDAEALQGLLQTGPTQHSAHSYVRCVIYSPDPTLFDPTTPATMPDGTFGQWSYPTKTYGARHMSGRLVGAFANCRYVEPERNPNYPNPL